MSDGTEGRSRRHRQPLSVSVEPPLCPLATISVDLAPRPAGGLRRVTGLEADRQARCQRAGWWAPALRTERSEAEGEQVVVANCVWGDHVERPGYDRRRALQIDGGGEERGAHDWGAGAALASNAQGPL